METASLARVQAAPVSAPAIRTDAVAARSVKTDLPPSEAVTSLNKGEVTRFDAADQNSKAQIGRAAVLNDAIERTIKIDEKTKDVIFQTIDQRSGEVVRQIPDAALLRIRTYVREVAQKAEEKASEVERVA